PLPARRSKPPHLHLCPQKHPRGRGPHGCGSCVCQPLSYQHVRPLRPELTLGAALHTSRMRPLVALRSASILAAGVVCQESSPMLQRLALCAFAALLAAAPRVFAQESSPVRWSIFGGANAPLSNTGDILQTGYDLGFALTWREPGHPLGIRLDLNY